MESKVLIFFLFLIYCSFLSMSEPTLQNEESNLQTYVVFLHKPQGRDFTELNDLHNWYSSFLPTNAFGSSKTLQLIHSYRHVATGFAAKLTTEEAKMLEITKEVVLVRPQRMLSLHTTHTPSFLGLEQNFGFWKTSNYGKGVIIGVVDSGIAPDHPSFRDEQMPPPPKKWKGKCELNETYSCNNKLIGARTFVRKSDVLDQVVHGTHTASIAAGSPVRGARYFGQYNGTARGIAPLAHVAMYKVSGREDKVGESEILAAMDAAIEDGVDVLSLSIGEASHPFYDDAIAIGAFAAVRKGILVSCSAGNSGPTISSVENEAPWILTVGASTVDRAIRATVLLGNNVKLDGQSLFQPKDFPPTLLPLIHAGQNGNESSMFCLEGSLKHVDVKGKIVLCEGAYDTVSKGREVKQNGGVAMIVMNHQPLDFITDVNLHVLPASHVSNADGSYIKAYINKSSSPLATILFEGTVVGLTNAPQVAMFSSRGPSKETPGILKPDIIGPGVDILGACPDSLDNTTNRFVIMSGTSMSCPHLSGVAALLKSSHPGWSPAAIKSAIMTTADLDNIGGNPISDQEFDRATVFDIGAGHVNPSKANDPGLIYDIEPEEYIGYLCGLGYSDQHIGIIVQHKVKCSDVSSIPEGQLNLPSFSVKFGPTPQMFTRTLTNVGKANSTYRVEIVEPKGVEVKVKPGRISFDKLNQKIKYSINFSKKGNGSGKFGEGYIIWTSGGYYVRSPIGVVMLD